MTQTMKEKKQQIKPITQTVKEKTDLRTIHHEGQKIAPG
jgi:hypothetical protein